MSDDDGDVIVMRMCAGVGCGDMEDLEFDEEVGELFCPSCLERRRAAEADYTVMLSDDDAAAVRMIFDHFDADGQGLWSFHDCNAYFAATGGTRREVPQFEDEEELAEYFLDEYGVECTNGGVVLKDLLSVYGGYAYHGSTALRQDLETLEDDAGLNTAALE